MITTSYLVLALALEPSRATELMTLFKEGAYPTVGGTLTLMGYRLSTEGDPQSFLALYRYDASDYLTFVDALTPYVRSEAPSTDAIFLGTYEGGFPRPAYNMIRGYNFLDVPNYVIADVNTNLLYVDPSLSGTQYTLFVYYGLNNHGSVPNKFPWQVILPFATSNNEELGDGEYSEGGSISGVVVDNLGETLEFRHFKSLPKNTSRSAEIQCTNKVLDNPFLSNLGKAEFVNKYSDLFFVDLSILTFHSPDIEFDTNLQTVPDEGVKLEIVGYVPITGTVSDYDLLTSTPALNYRADEDKSGAYKTVAQGFYKEGVGETSINTNGFKGLVTTNAWLDEMYSSTEKLYNNNHITYGFPVYPWHRSGSMNNQSYNSTSNDKDETAPNNYRSAMLKTKKMSNLRFSFNSLYLSTTLEYGLNDFQIFSSDLLVNTRMISPTGDSINYYGNVDKLVNNMSTFYIDSSGFVQEGSASGYTTITGYRLAATTGLTSNRRHYLFSFNPTPISKIDSVLPNWKDAFSVDPIQMKYKSGIHGVLSLLSAADNTLRILPSMNSNNTISKSGTPFWDTASVNTSLTNINASCNYGYLWLANLVRTNVSNKFGGSDNDAIQANNWIPCGEAVSLDDINDDGTVDLKWTEGDTFYQRYDCLKTYPFTMEDPNSIVDILSFRCETRINLDGRYDKNRGQTNNLVMHPTIFNRLNEVYNQRNNFFNYRILDNTLFNFDKYPYSVTWTKTKSNGEKVDTWTNITMASTMDLDGNKGEVTALRKTGDLIIAFLPRGISHILYNELTLIVSTLGVPIEISNSNKVTGKRYISDTIGCYNKWSICDTPNGIYFFDSYNKQLYLYNGLIANISDTKGMHTWFANNCPTEKWNPMEFDGIVSYYDMTNQDVFFISRDWCLAFSEGLGVFTSFYNYEESSHFFNFKGNGYWLRTNNNDIDLEDLTGSILLNLIEADTVKYPSLNKTCSTTDSKTILYWQNAGVLKSPIATNTGTCYTLSSTASLIASSIKFETTSCGLWKHNAGSYNYFFGRYKPFSTTVIVNPDFLHDKIFSTLDFRSDVWDKNGNYKPKSTLDTLETWNEYLHGKITLIDEQDKPTSLKKKFRVWRALIPRNNFKDSYEGETEENRINRVSRDRMRNPWLYLKLSKETVNSDRIILHDMIVNYFI